MSFVVRKSAHRLWPVIVRLHVADEAGAVTPVEHTFVAHFKPFTEAEHAAITDEIDAAYPKPESGDMQRDRILERNTAYFARLLCGWGGEVVDETGAPIDYSEEALRVMVTGPDGFAVSEALFVAIAEIRFGGAPLKNLLTSVAPGESSSAAGVETTATKPI